MPAAAQSFDGASKAAPAVPAAPTVERIITETPPQVRVATGGATPLSRPTSKFYQAGYKQVDLPHHQFGNDIGGGVAPEFDRETRPAHIPGQQKVRGHAAWFIRDTAEILS